MARSCASFASAVTALLAISNIFREYMAVCSLPFCVLLPLLKMILFSAIRSSVAGAALLLTSESFLVNRKA